MFDSSLDTPLSILALALGSVVVCGCDPEPGPTTPEPLQAASVDELVALADDDDPRRQAVLPPGTCDRMARPSVYVKVVRRFTDYYVPVDVDAVWFEHDGQTSEALCVLGDRGCETWLAGYDLLGPIVVSTEHCGDVVSETVVVEPTADGCHADTRFMMLEVSTRGCLTSNDPPPSPPPPSPPPWPTALVDRSE